MRRVTIADVFRSALGTSPSEWKTETLLGLREIESIRAHYLHWSCGMEAIERRDDELWPLISHHDINSNVVLRGFLSQDSTPNQSKDPVEELKSHLTACNGVVLADPLRRVFFDADGKEVLRPSGADIRRIADRIGQFERLLDDGVLVVSKVHPFLAAQDRQQYIAPFNLGTDLQVLIDVIQEGYWVASRPEAERRLYPIKVQQLMAVCGIRDIDFPVDTSPLDRVILFAQTLMEVSWQLAHVVISGADLYLTTALEKRVFEVLVEYCADTLAEHDVITEGPTAQGRHLEELATVGLPALDVNRISFQDIVDIRAGEAFENWRNTLNGALDTYMTTRNVRGNKIAVAAFRTELRAAAERLNADAQGGSLRSMIRETKYRAPLSVVAASATAQMTGSSVAGAMVAAVTMVDLAVENLWRYLTHRQSRADRAAVRFLAAFQPAQEYHASTRTRASRK